MNYLKLAEYYYMYGVITLAVMELVTLAIMAGYRKYRELYKAKKDDVIDPEIKIVEGK